MKYRFYPLHKNKEIPSCEELFDSKEEIRQRLISYHSADWEAETDINTLTLDEILDHGQWEIKEIAFQCPLCAHGHVEAKEWKSLHIYSCEECPFFAFEYINGHEHAKDLEDYANFN